jgi:probable rRNA maturation factor
MSPEGSSVTFRRSHEDIRPRAIQAFARKLQAEVAKGRAFDCVITGDAELRRLNREFRGKDQPTDVLSFGSEPRVSSTHARFRAATARERSATSTRLGDIAISAQRARAQAREFGHTTEQEVRVLMLHGVLHLLGMDHETDGGRMARAERQWRSKLRLANGLIERVRA